MKIDKEKYVKEIGTVDAEVIEDREGEEVTEKTLHFLITNADTGEVVHECDTSCCMVVLADKEEPTNVLNLNFNTETNGVLFNLFKTAIAAVELIKKQHPIFGMMYDIEKMVRGISEDEEEDE